jgi:hypothetical protein
MTKLCTNCKHSESVAGVRWCNHPSLGTSLVYGDSNSMRCQAMRNTNVYCGEDASLFEPKPTLKEILWRILKLK